MIKFSNMLNCQAKLINKVSSRGVEIVEFDTVKLFLGGHSKRNKLLLNAGQKYFRMLHESILQYFRPSLSYDLSLFCQFLSGRLRQVLLYLPRNK